MAKVALLLVALCAASAAAAAIDDLRTLVNQVKSNDYPSSALQDDNSRRMTTCESAAEQGKTTETTDILATCYMRGWNTRQQGTKTALSNVGDCALSAPSPSDETIQTLIDFLTCTSNAYRSSS